MSLAGEMGPYLCIEVMAEKMGDNMETILNNMPDGADTPKEKLLKFSTIEKCLIGIKEATKEMMAARVMGTIQAVDENEAGSRQASLTEMEKKVDDTQVSISVNGGKEVNLTLAEIERAQDKLKGELDRRAGQE
jgi:hypothetical protein